MNFSQEVTLNDEKIQKNTNNLEKLEQKMELIFKEKSLSEYEEFNEGETIKEPDGYEFEVPTWATNKRTAKRYFKLEGWHYSKELVFCKDCFEQLKKGYVVIDQFHMFYNDEMICDIADPGFLKDLDQARQFASKTYNNEVVYFKKVFPIICQSLREEWEVDVVGHYKAHTETRL